MHEWPFSIPWVIVWCHPRLVISWKGLVSRENNSKNNWVCKSTVPQIPWSGTLLDMGPCFWDVILQSNRILCSRLRDVTQRSPQGVSSFSGPKWLLVGRLTLEWLGHKHWLTLNTTVLHSNGWVGSRGTVLGWMEAPRTPSLASGNTDNQHHKVSPRLQSSSEDKQRHLSSHNINQTL